jgi:hypothetical protein
MNLLHKPFQGLVRPLGQEFNGSIRFITDPAPDPMLESLVLGEIAESNPLDPAKNSPRKGLGQRQVPAIVGVICQFF